MVLANASVGNLLAPLLTPPKPPIPYIPERHVVAPIMCGKLSESRTSVNFEIKSFARGFKFSFNIFDSEKTFSLLQNFLCPVFSIVLKYCLGKHE